MHWIENYYSIYKLQYSHLFLYLFNNISIQKFTLKLRYYVEVRNPANREYKLHSLCSTLTDIPRFLRFGNVEVRPYPFSKRGEPTKLIAEVCESFRPFLQLLRGHKAAIKNSSFALYAHTDILTRTFEPTYKKF